MPRDISDDDTGPIRRVPAGSRSSRDPEPRGHASGRATRRPAPERDRTPRAERPRRAPRRPTEPEEPGKGGKPALPVGHGHGHGPAEPASRRVKLLLLALLAPFALATVAGVALLYPWGEPAAHGANAVGIPVHGDVTATEAGPCLAPGQVQVGEPPEGGSQCLAVDILLTDGDAAGTTIRKTMPLEPSTPRFATGDAVVLAYSGAQPEDSESYQLQDFQRGTPLLILAGLFALAVIVLGRWRGLAALVALGLSFVVLAVFVLPAILHGENPLLVAIAGSGLIMFVALYLTHGLSARTSVAVLGTMVSLTLIGILSAIFSAMSDLTGLSDDTSTLIASLGHGIDARGLLLAGVVIGALGVLDDVTVTQTSAVWELRRANPSLGWRELYGSGLRIGRDHVGSAVNTLVMAYAGAALPVLLLASLSGVGLGSILGSQDIASEIVRTLAGSIGIVAAVPVTTVLAALIVVREDLPDHISPASSP
ncbi:YibE/F family protein [Prauserella flavalba]|uniref:YibE/F n=1 Tax=Prauserella flavalba TaxID=1477506 RepID=A0A318LKN7_9PSEU|nr:YibE/F family protein [Prauserella flavalba]PXY29557.1 YibE/F [Prauserella flavalba]